MSAAQPPPPVFDVRRIAARAGGAMRPVVKPALRRVWRDSSTVQIGVQHERALVLAGVSAKAASLLNSIDGVRDTAALRRTATELGLDGSVADRLVAMLGAADLLDDASTDLGSLATLPRVERDRLAPDLASMSLVSGRPDGGVSTVARRLATSVSIVGAGRVGAAVATILAAAGVGHIVVDDSQTCRPADCGPAGLALADTGTSRAQAAHAAIRQASPSTSTAAAMASHPADIVVLASPGATDPAAGDALMRAGVPHISATVREATALVGPLVVPGLTTCLRCLELHRSDRDPAWPMIAAQLSTDGAPAGVEACDVALATLAASVCALQVLGFVDGLAPATYDGTLELSLPDWRLRRRSWGLHPACGCAWVQAT